MKNRIKIITDSDGRKTYFPQIKLLFFWLNIPVNEYKDVYFENLEDCKKYLSYDPVESVEFIPIR